MACRAGWEEISPTGDTERKIDMSFKIKSIRPLFTGVVTTAKKYVGDQHADVNGLILDTRKMDGSLNPYQTVIAVGATVRDVKEGEVVKINFNRYVKTKHTPGAIDEALNTQFDNMSLTYEIPTIFINDQECLYLQVNDIEYVITEYDVDEGGLLQ